ncbi:hypothetical protein BG24_1024 [Burkholderia pseudomallei PB08298010]|nr:hypothetical protein BG24_1024 [Burkholderia pseudomallei PB08298010]
MRRCGTCGCSDCPKRASECYHMSESIKLLLSDMAMHPCPKGNSFGHYESRAADLDCGDSEVGERCFVRFGLEVALRGPHVLPIYAKGRQVELASTARFPDAVTLLSNDVFQSSSGAARAERGAMLRTGRLKQRPARDAPVCSYCLSQCNDPTLSSVPCCSLVYACTFSRDAMKKHTATLAHRRPQSQRLFGLFVRYFEFVRFLRTLRVTYKEILRWPPLTALPLPNSKR